MLISLDPRVTRPSNINDFLSANHYLGRISTGIAWSDKWGVMVLGSPTSRRLPANWLEIKRWCLLGKKNGGSQQFKAVRRWVTSAMPNITTIVSYSDPSVGHTGALYKACNFYWAPTWHRLRPPPTGNGSWSNNKKQHVKDRWVFDLRPDQERQEILRVKDAALANVIDNRSYDK
jgi:hypothetical protein